MQAIENLGIQSQTVGESDDTGNDTDDIDALWEDDSDPPSSKQITYSQVTRSHHVPKDQRETCQNPDCAALFTYLLRPHHCRRCGEVFCYTCLQFKRRLNQDAQLDKHGVLCKVCPTCFEERPREMGPTVRRRTKEFKQIREQSLEEKRDLECDITMETKKCSIIPRFWKEQFKVDVSKECQRLLDGFRSAVGGSETLRTLHEIEGNHLKVPNWQKSSFWMLEKSMSTCRKCSKEIKRKKRMMKNCRVCGLSLCKKCSNRELLLYFEDRKKGGTYDRNPRIAIIRHVGCPEKEPNISLLLHVCEECKEDIVQRQTTNVDWFHQKPKPPDDINVLLTIDETFRDLRQKIEDDIENSEVSFHMAQYSTMISKLEAIKRDMRNGSENKEITKNKLFVNYIQARKYFYWQTKSEVGRLAEKTGFSKSLYSNYSLQSDSEEVQADQISIQ